MIKLKTKKLTAKERDILQQSKKKLDKPIKKVLAEKLVRAGGNVIDWIKPAGAGVKPLNLQAAQDLCERASLSSVLPFCDIEADGTFTCDDGYDLRLGFIIEYSPFAQVGTDSELQIETIIQICSELSGSVIQYGVQGSTELMNYFNAWAEGRSAASSDAVIHEMTASRRDFFKGAMYCGHDTEGQTYGYSLAYGRRIHPKAFRYIITVTMPYRGAPENDLAWDRFVNTVKKIRSSILGTLEGAQLRGRALDRADTRHFLRTLLNPQHLPEVLSERDASRLEIGDDVPLVHASRLIERDTRTGVEDDAVLKFDCTADKNDPRRVYIVPMTVDRYPSKSYLPNTANLIGSLIRTAECIHRPFWMYTTIVTLDTDDTKERLMFKTAGVSRQLVSDSPAYRAMMGHLFEMKDQLVELTTEAGKGRMLCAAYMGINVYTDRESAYEDAQTVAAIWKRSGFELSAEKQISLPIFLASIPGVFVEDMDPLEARAGLQRISTMTSFQASTLVPMQGEWGGCDARNGGILVTSRRGQPAAINIQDRGNTNYNFAVVADSGAGKSFFAQDIVLDFLSKGGMAYIIDAGKSYYEMVEQLGGVNLVFKMDSPLDLNPFTYIKNELHLKEMMELLKDVLRYMIWPQSADVTIPDWQYILLEHAIEESWQKRQDLTTLNDLADWLSKHVDPRAKDMASQLRPYTEGRISDWFNGKGKKIDLRGSLICLEMDELKNQGAFRDVALTLVMQRIADSMYRDGNQERPKLMLIDEAWDLLSSNQAGPFINRAYRTYRKYGGSAGVITQQFGDFEKSEAAKAAYAGSSWLFVLKQKPESIETAFNKGYLSGDDYLKQLLPTVHTVKGVYSEIYIRSDMGSGVYRFIVDPYTYWLYTTDARDKTKRTKLIQEVQARDPILTRTQAMAIALKELAHETYLQRLKTTPQAVLERLNYSYTH